MQRFREIIEDISNISIQGYDEQRKVIFWNNASQDLYGYSEEEAVGKKIEDLIIPDHMHSEVITLVQRWVEFGEKIPPGPVDLVDKYGQVVPVYSSHVMLETASGKEMFCIDIDLRAIRQTEEALHRSEELFKAVVETAKDAIFIKNSRMEYQKVNPAMERMLKKKAEEIIGRTETDILPPEISQPALAADSRVLKGEIVEEMPVLLGKNKKHFFHTIKVPLRDTEGRITGICGIARDITEYRKMQKERADAQKLAGEQEKLALVGQIAGKMAHDFNNILGIIMGTAELAILDSADPEMKKVLELILDQTMRGKNLTRNLVAFAKDQEPKQEFFSLNEKIDLVVNLLKKDLKGIRVIRQDSLDVPDLLADPGMIEHALVNFIQNSIHSLSRADRPWITLKTYSEDDWICFEILDNGCGIPEEYLQRIYDPAFTLKGSYDTTASYKAGIKGTGYGMSNIKKYIEQHKGRIEVESAPGEGTRFVVRLPIIEKDLNQAEKEQIEKAVFFSGKYILLVEDETAISDVMYRVLTQPPLNHTVDIAQNGQIAVDLLKRNAYDLVSLDYILPGDINGMDVYTVLRSRGIHTPVLFISGNITFLESLKQIKRKDRYMDHLSKPCRNIEYLNAINRLLSKVI